MIAYLCRLALSQRAAWPEGLAFCATGELRSRAGDKLRSPTLRGGESAARFTAKSCNLLFDCPMQRYFHAEPHVLATELLLHERLPASVVAEAEPAIVPAVQRVV